MSRQKGAIYKYLNPNVISVATLRASKLPHVDIDFHSSIIYYIIDGTTGGVLNRTTHVGGGLEHGEHGSVKIMQHENWAIMSFWNHGFDTLEGYASDTEVNFVKKIENTMLMKDGSLSSYIPTASNRKGFEVAVYEMYESLVPEVRIPGASYNPYHIKRPTIISQSYVLPFSMEPIGVTSTGLGVTTSEIILKLPTDQVIGISKLILDAKRPVSKSFLDKKSTSGKDPVFFYDNSLTKYSPLIPLNPTSIYGQGAMVMGVSNAVCSPSRLESTSVVLLYGIDILYTVRSPSGVFDRLNDKFNKLAILITMFILVISAIISKRYSTFTKYKKTWN